MIVSWDKYFQMPLISDYGGYIVIYGSPHEPRSSVDKKWRSAVKRRFKKWRKRERLKKLK